jgi:pimeloyl-ACP methyl ester carboxylesterase
MARASGRRPGAVRQSGVPAIDLPFGRIFFREKGQGEALVLVMGTGADHTSWARQFPALSGTFRVLAPDNRGSGRSGPAPGPEATTASFARETIAWLDALGVRSFHVAGYSFGAAVAMEIALHAPGRVLAASFHAGWAGPNPATTAALEQSLEAARAGAAAFLEAACRRNMSPAFQAAPAFADFLRNVLDGAALPTREGIVAQTRAGLRHDVRARLPALSVPCLITTGEHDPVAPPAAAEEVAALVPKSRLHVFRGPRAWHAIPLEMPEEFNAIVADFHRAAGSPGGPPG